MAPTENKPKQKLSVLNAGTTEKVEKDSNNIQHNILIFITKLSSYIIIKFFKLT